MNNTQTSKWYVDLTLFIGFIIAFFLDLTGLELHQWIGVAASSLAIYHLITHWTWVSAVTERFFSKTSLRARLYYLIDAAIFTGFLIIGLTGLVISSWLNLSLTHYDLWLQVHIQASILTLILTVVKISLHWRWVVATTKKIFAPTNQQAQHEIPTLKPVPMAAPAVIHQPVNRRDFIKMMGIVGAASVIALGSAASGLNDANAEPSGSEAATSSTQGLSSDSFETFGSDQTCVVRCGRGCSYPGHCHRYTDTNGNNRCDFGECM